MNSKINTCLLAGVIGLSGWTLFEINSQGKEFAALKEQVATATRDTSRVMERTGAVENQIQTLRLELAASGWKPAR